MKKIYSLILVLFLPIMIHAETITYNVCSGCEYSSLSEVGNNINAIEDLSDKDIIINIDVDHDFHYEFGSNNNMIKSLVINGNNHATSFLRIHADNVTINDFAATDIIIHESNQIIVNNSNINLLRIIVFNKSYNSDEIILNETLKIDDVSFNNINTMGLAGNIKIENINFKNILVENIAGKLNFYNCQFNKIINRPESNIDANIYNSTFESLKYKRIVSDEDYSGEFNNFSYINPNFDLLNYDIYDLTMYSNTTVYFDKNIEMKPNETVNLAEYLDYYISDKEIDCVIEDKTIAKIENKELVGLKEGQTNITVTTDDGHVVYRIKLNVIKENIAEKIDEMTVNIPITGTKIKVWVLVSIIMLFGVIGVIIYLLIKSKKSK